MTTILLYEFSGSRIWTRYRRDDLTMSRASAGKPWTAGGDLDGGSPESSVGFFTYMSWCLGCEYLKAMFGWDY